eukprot:SAG31_NODE_16180_length_720_cov_0.655395_2_plen_69_part_00
MMTDTGSFLGPVVAGLFASYTSVFAASDGIAACAVSSGLWLALAVEETYAGNKGFEDKDINVASEVRP